MWLRAALCRTQARSFSASPRVRNEELYRKKLEDYFCTTKFNIKPEKREANIQALRKTMETVYLRKVPLVAFDVEAYEKSPQKVTEIGIAVYDPVVLQQSMLPIITQGHIIIEEHKTLHNRRYCPDNKAFFMGGVSHMADMKTARKIITGVMDEYITNRNGSFVGHHIEGDIKWLRSLNINISDQVGIVDTGRLHSYSRRRGATLRGILRLVGIPHGYLHNAGNDAYYTLLAAMALCDPQVRKARGLDDFVENERLTNPQLRLLKFTDNAKVLDTKEYEGKVDELFVNTDKR